VRVAVNRERASLIFEGLVQVPADGIYTFELATNGGARMYVADDEILVDMSTATEPAQRARIGLRAGWHPFRLAWFDGVGDPALELRCLDSKGALVELRYGH
jgi:hexosaminidase